MSSDDNTSFSTQEARPRPWYYINKRLLSCKAAYLALLSKEYVFRMNLILLLTSIGLSTSQAGFVAGLRLIAAMIGAPTWGMISDRYHIPRTVIVFITIVTVTCASIQPLLAYNFGSHTFKYCPSSLNSINNASLATMHVDNMSLTTTPTTAPKQTYHLDYDRALLFKIMLAINFIQSFFDGGFDAFIDAGVMTRLDKINKLEGHKRHTFGTQRISGVLSIAISPVICNFLIDLFPSDKVTCYTAVYIVHFLMILATGTSTFWLCSGLQFGDHEEKTAETEGDNQQSPNEKEKLRLVELENTENDQAPKSKQNFRQVFFGVLRKKDMMFMFFNFFIGGWLLSQYISFSFPYMHDLNTTTLELNIFLVVSTIAGVIGFLNANRVIRIVGGHFNAIALAFVFYSIRFVAAASTNSALVVALLQIMRVFGACVVETVSVEYTVLKTPKSVLKTMFGVVNAMQYSSADIIATTVGGVIYENYGGKVWFYSGAVIAAVAAMLVVTFSIVKKFFVREKTQAISNDEENIFKVGIKGLEE